MDFSNSSQIFLSSTIRTTVWLAFRPTLSIRSRQMTLGLSSFSFHVDWPCRTKIIDFSRRPSSWKKNIAKKVMAFSLLLLSSSLENLPRRRQRGTRRRRRRRRRRRDRHRHVPSTTRFLFLSPCPYKNMFVYIIVAELM